MATYSGTRLVPRPIRQSGSSPSPLFGSKNPYSYRYLGNKCPSFQFVPKETAKKVPSIILIKETSVRSNPLLPCAWKPGGCSSLARSVSIISKSLSPKKALFLVVEPTRLKKYARQARNSPQFLGHQCREQCNVCKKLKQLFWMLFLDTSHGHPAMERPLPQSWSSPSPFPTIADYNGTLQWHPAMAPRPLPQSWSS